MNPAAVPSTPGSTVHAFVLRHQKGLWRYLRALGCEPACADEHCQDAILAGLHRGIERLPTVEAARWLRRAGKNLFLAQLRAETRRPRVVSLDEIDAGWTALRGDHDGGSAALTALSRCLLKLPARERDLVARRYEQAQSRSDMARDLGLREAGIKMALRRAREKLRHCVTRQLATDARTPSDQRSRT